MDEAKVFRSLEHNSVLMAAPLLLLVGTLACGKKPEPLAVSKVDSPSVPPSVSTADLDFDLKGLAPRLRDELKKIKILIIRDGNVADIWTLTGQSSPDIVALDCSAELLSTDMLISLRTWASEGRGILVAGKALPLVWSYFSPQDLEPYYSYGGMGRMTVVKGSTITENVSSVQNFLWCAADSAGIKLKRADQELNRAEISQALSNERERFIPIVVQSHYDTRGDGYLPFQAFATTWRGARIAWLPSDLSEDPERPCNLLVDDARLWSNLAHWLAG